VGGLSTLLAEAIRRDIKLLIEHKSKFVLVHSSSGHKHSLKEVPAARPPHHHAVQRPSRKLKSVP
jgi:hypothetical protein